MLTFPKHETYQDSQVSWLNEVPNHWRVELGRNYLRPKNVKNIGNHVKTVLSLSYGKIVIKPKEKLHGLVPESFETYQIVEPGDIIVRATDLQNDRTSLRIGLVQDHGIITSAYLCLSPSKQIDPRFTYYLLHAYDLLKVYYGMGSGLRQNLDYTDFKYLPLTIPPIDEQRRIVEFLDRKTAEIDDAIATKQRLIELLQEQKAILINQAVTKGLDPNVPMRDSGVDWLGNIPKHWDVQRAKYLFKEVDERSKNGTEELLSVSHMTGVTPRSEKNVYMFMAEDYTGSKLCQKDDLVINIMWAWMGALGVSDRTGIISPSYGVFRQRNQKIFNSWYLEHLLRSPEYVAQYNRISTGLHSSRLRLYAHMFLGMEILLPPKEEQDRITKITLEQTAIIDTAINSIEDEIAAMHELQAIFITKAVTGKVKV